MDRGVLIAVILLIALVVGVNGLLFLGLRRGRRADQIRMLQRTARKARDPWAGENEQLKELSDLVKKIKDPDEQG